MKQKQIIEETYQDKNVVSEFDSTRKRFMFQEYKHATEWNFLFKVLGEVESRQHKQIKMLDVACGTGRMFKEIEHYYTPEQIQYHGVDTSEEMMKHLQEYADEQEFLVNLKVGDATKLPYPDNTFDITYSFHLTWHLPKGLQYQMINEMKRVTKPGGFVVFDVLNENFYWEKVKHWFGKEKLKDIYKLDLNMLEAGFVTNDYKVEKLNDFPIKNGVLYSIANIVNLVRDFLPKNAFHMLYYSLEV